MINLPSSQGRKHDAGRQQRVDMAETLSATLVVTKHKAHLHREKEKNQQIELK
jgi:hypothetical protein